MPEPTAQQLVKEYMGREGGWVIPRADGAVQVPIKVVDVKTTYGRIRLLCQIARTNQTTWLDTSSVKLLPKENEDA